MKPIVHSPKANVPSCLPPLSSPLWVHIWNSANASYDPILRTSLPHGSYRPLPDANPYNLPGCLAGSNLSVNKTTLATVIKLTFSNYRCYHGTSPASKGLSQWLWISPWPIVRLWHHRHYLWSMRGPSCSLSHFHFYTWGFPLSLPPFLCNLS